MKRRVTLVIIGTLLFISTILIAETHHNGKTLVISAGSELTAHQPQIIIPILTEALKRAGYSLKPVHYPSPRSLLYSNSGVVDGEMHRIDEFHDVSKGSYPNLYRINSPVMSAYIAAFATDNTIDISTFSDLIPYAVAFKRGRKNLESILPRHLFSNQLYPTASDKEAFHMLSQGQVEVVISEKIKGDKIISEDKSLKKIRLVGLLDEIQIHTYLHVKHRELADQISHTLDKMKQEGSFQSISEKANTEFITSQSPENTESQK